MLCSHNLRCTPIVYHDYPLQHYILEPYTLFSPLLMALGPPKLQGEGVLDEAYHKTNGP